MKKQGLNFRPEGNANQWRYAMKGSKLILLFLISLVALGVAMLAQGQKSQTSNPSATISATSNSERPFCYYDQNKDGICDYCGRSIGSVPGWRGSAPQTGTTVGGKGLGLGQGYGNGYGCCNGRGRGMGRGCPWRQNVQPQQPK
jgi:hypothetical protein